MKSDTAILRHGLRKGTFSRWGCLVILASLAVLFVISIRPFSCGPISGERNRTIAVHGAIRAALEEYKKKFGDYPEPAVPSEEDKFAGTSLPIGGSHMLYQATTGDGSSAIVMESPRSTGASESDGKVSDDELPFTLNGIYIPKSIIYPPNIPPGTVQPRLLVDGWGRPFQYTKADPDPAKNKAVNSTYDLWSMGPKPGSPPSSDSLASKRDEKVSGSWIKNW